eukprot:Sspe_Gene.1314::Locus_445_Transcript_5_10_Confidence_0.364_Length_430::g.1314::m.1314
MYEGLADLCRMEVTNLAPNSMKIRVVAPPRAEVLGVDRGAILSSLSTFPVHVGQEGRSTTRAAPASSTRSASDFSFLFFLSCVVPIAVLPPPPLPPYPTPPHP